MSGFFSSSEDVSCRILHLVLQVNSISCHFACSSRNIDIVLRQQKDMLEIRVVSTNGDGLHTVD